MGRPSRTGGTPSLDRLALTRTDAAHLITVSPREFDELVSKGDMPGPRRIGKFERWLRRDIEAALNAAPEASVSAKLDPYSIVS